MLIFGLLIFKKNTRTTCVRISSLYFQFIQSVFYMIQMFLLVNTMPLKKLPKSLFSNQNRVVSRIWGLSKHKWCVMLVSGIQVTLKICFILRA